MWVGITIFILMGLFPLVRQYEGRYGGYSQGVSYEFLLFTDPSDLALTHLTIQWIIVSALTIGAIYSIKGSKEKVNVGPEKDTL